ncbi:MAG: DUF4384 domain-containing protein [Rhodobacterales bacterium]|nr:DUF4384 domain-containing protein [Rhodobacterales bacterium]
MRYASLAGVGCTALLLAACQTTSENALETANPKSPPARTITGFSESLTCMDNLFLQQGIKGITMTAQDIPDLTLKTPTGTKDMLISALSRMSTRSGAVRFVAYGSDLSDIVDLQNAHKSTSSFTVPDYFLRGSISQLDEGVQNDQAGGGISLGMVNFGGSVGKVVSVVSVDMNMGCVKDLQMVPGLTSSNSVAVVSKGASAEFGAVINATSLTPGSINMNLSSDRNEGVHQSVRTLIELGAIELMGKMTGVPYKTCLPQPLPPKTAKGAAPPPVAPVSYAPTPPLRLCEDAATAVTTAAADNGPATMAAAGPAQGEPAAAQQPAMPELGLDLRTDRGVAPVYNVGESVVLTATPSETSYLACYYQEGQGDMVKLFPNPFDRASVVQAGQPLVIPGPNSLFSIKAETSGSEDRFLCVATTADLDDRLPLELVESEMAPIPVNGLEDIAGVYEEAGAGEPMAAQLLTVRVR